VMKSDSKADPRFSANGKARYIMIGGFLGAGKTTSVARLAKYLTEKGCKVGLITNDQGQELVDTAMLRSRGFDTEEIRGGCFCCRFNSLTEAAEKLSASSRPHVFIAEPVGSCTDLVATVSYPLRRMYGNEFRVAPLSVLIDPVRASQIFGLEDGRKFSEKVAYIYRKQLEEADIIIINKTDLLEHDALNRLHQRLSRDFPKAIILEISAREGKGLDQWFEKILSSEQDSRHAMEIDYDTYAEGEALLGWLNCTVKLSSRKYFDSGEVLMIIATSIQDSLCSEGAEIAHLKMTLNPDEDLGDLAVINLVRNDYVPELSQKLPESIESGELIINLRAEADPRLLNTAVNRAIIEAVDKTPTLFARMEHSEHFRPGKPQPTHRLEQAG
jgi:G3E family GTPase